MTKNNNLFYLETLEDLPHSGADIRFRFVFVCKSFYSEYSSLLQTHLFPRKSEEMNVVTFTGLGVVSTAAMNKTGICRKILLKYFSIIKFSNSGKPTDMLIT